MKDELKITIENGIASIYTPYDKLFIQKIKSVAGRKWDSEKKCWTVPESEVEVVRKHMKAVYGVTDIEGIIEMVTLEVKFEKEVVKKKGIYVHGKLIAKPRNQYEIQFSNDVTLLAGEIRTAGVSIHNPDILVEAGTVVKVINVPKYDIGCYSNPVGVTYKIIEEATNIDKEKLISEKEKLLARLAEIDKLLETA